MSKRDTAVKKPTDLFPFLQLDLEQLVYCFLVVQSIHDGQVYYTA